MSVQSKIAKRKIRRARLVRTKIRKTTSLARVSVFRSLSQIYVQLIDDAQQATVASASSLTMKDVKGSKTDLAHAVGVALAKDALAKGVKKAVFDRGRFLYHGRVKALAEGIREGGLQI